MLNCIIVDDEQHAVDLMVHHVQQTSFLKLIHYTTNPIEALEKVNTQKIDLAFVDVQMPQLSGLEFVKAVKGNCNVILCTAYPQYALDGFENDVIDYLLKPVTYTRFIRGAQKALNMLAVRNSIAEPTAFENHIFIRTESKGKMIKIDFDEIDFIEGQKNYIAFHIGKVKKMALMTMKEIMERLQGKRFIRVHNSFIVPIDKISMIEGNMLEIKNHPQLIPIGPSYKESVVEILRLK